MLRSRVAPVLLIRNKGLVKTVNFRDDVYVGDPLNAVKIFNEKQVDELFVYDIDASREGRAPDLRLIEKLAIECRMPLCIGGGVASKNVAADIIQLGVEKVSLSSAALENPTLVSEIAHAVGRQSVVVTLDCKRNFFGGYDIYTCNGTRKHKFKLNEAIELFQDIGIGELCVNSIDRDGTMKGFDENLVSFVVDRCSSPVSFIGGAKSQEDIFDLADNYGPIGIGVGSLFVFKGPYKAVLISYLNRG